MGNVVASTGYYNDRRVIRFVDGAVEYPTLEVIPLHQTEERIAAYRRLVEGLRGEPIDSIPEDLRLILEEQGVSSDSDTERSSRVHEASEISKMDSPKLSEMGSRRRRAGGTTGERDEQLLGPPPPAKTCRNPCCKEKEDENQIQWFSFDISKNIQRLWELRKVFGQVRIHSDEDKVSEKLENMGRGPQNQHYRRGDDRSASLKS